jgi:hypothetical protein
LAGGPSDNDVGFDLGERELAQVRHHHLRPRKVRRERLAAVRIGVDREDAAVSSRSVEAESKTSRSREEVNEAQIGHWPVFCAKLRTADFLRNA